MIQRFGDFCLDTGRFELTASGEPVAIEPQVFRLIALLIDRREQVVSKDDLIETVWNGRIVSEATLNSRINAARRALGDNGRDQKVIRTIARRGFRFVADVRSEAGEAEWAIRQTTSGPSLPTRPALAILPFHNMSDDPEQVYFADGLAEDIITALSRQKWLFVVSRNSSFAYRQDSLDIAETARELGATYLLQGSVRRAGPRIRVTGQLTDATTTGQIWAERYDRDFTDVFAIQDDITASIAAALVPEITLAEIERSRRKRPDSLDAWDLYLRALSAMHRLEPSANEAAIADLTRAVEIDPDFVAAHSGLVWCRALSALHRWPGGGFAALDLMDRHARRAVFLDADDARAHCALALSHFWRGHQEEGVATAKRAIELDPNMAEAHGMLGSIQALAGEPESGIESLQRAIRRSPRDPVRWFWYHGMANAHFALGNDSEAIRWARAAGEIRPGWAFAHLIIAASSAALGQLDDARQAVRALRSIIPGYDIARFRRNPMWTRPQDVERLIDGFRAAGLAEGRDKAS